MKYQILIGGKAGQGINKISIFISKILAKRGYYVFNYRDYQSLIRGGHNFNIVCFSDKKISSCERKIDFLVCLDEKTEETHKKNLDKKGMILRASEFENLKLDVNIALSIKLGKIFGISLEDFLDVSKEEFPNKENLIKELFEKIKQEKKIELKNQKKNIELIDGSHAVAKGAFESGLDFFLAYPMTPATGLLNALIENHTKFSKPIVLQPESEISVINMALGISFAGNLTMIGTSGGGFDLMTEGLSFAGQSEIPIVVYLASRPGPSTGVPTYTCQQDLNLALFSGHGEFPRVVLSPSNPEQAIKRINEAFYLTEKFKIPVIFLTEKHFAESLFSVERFPSVEKIKIRRKIPGEFIVKASSYEHNEKGETTEDEEEIKKGFERRLKKERELLKEIEKLSPFEISGQKNSKNLIFCFGSTKNVIEDVVNYENLDAKILQIVYLNPFSEKIKNEIKKAKNVFVVEENSTSQLSRLIKEKTGFEIPEKNRILKYNGRPFFYDELKEILEEKMK
ncbi:MAG: 2-oxoacid:acceptor oxidoreductase family protein [Candidatus Pacearchaeota archaeon]